MIPNYLLMPMKLLLKVKQNKKRFFLIDSKLFVFILVRSSKEPGWVMGTVNGKTGLIPENYINFTSGV